MAQDLVALDSKLTVMADAMADAIAARGGDRPPGAATLLTYRLDEDFTGFEPQSWRLGFASVHRVMTDRLRLALARRGVRSRCVFMDAEAYDEWRLDQGAEDAEATRRL